MTRPTLLGVIFFIILNQISRSAEESWPIQIPGWVAPAPGEHPRLLFRKSDIPGLKRRAETPEGKAIIARLKVLLGGGESMPTLYNTDKVKVEGNKTLKDGIYTVSTAAGFGFLYQLTSDKKYAQFAKECFEKAWDGQRDGDNRYSWMNPGGALRAGPTIAWYAVAYDLCYEGWDEPTRQKVGQMIQDYGKGDPDMGLEGLAKGHRQHPGSNHWGAIVGGGSMAVLAIKEDPGIDKKIEAWVEEAKKSTLKQLTNGWGDHGFYVEGDGPGCISSDTAFIPALLAWKNAAGLDFVSPRPNAQWMTMKWVMESITNGKNASFPIRGTYEHNVFARRGFSGSGLFSQGFGAITEEQKPALLWLYNHSFKNSDDQENQPFDTTSPYPHRCILALVNWPFGLTERNPAEILPKAVMDKAHNFLAFRNQWKDSDDIVVTALTAGAKGNYGCPGGEVMVWGLGRKTTFPAKLLASGGILTATKNGGTFTAGNVSFAADFSNASGCPGLLVMTGSPRNGKSEFPTATAQIGGTNLIIQFITKEKPPDIKVEGEKVIVGGQIISLMNGSINLAN